MLTSQLTDWKSTQSDGTLPLDTDADEMQVRRYLQWELDPSGIGINFQDRAGSWEYQIEDAAGLPIFRQKVTETLRLVTLGAPGLELFSWQHLREKIETTIIDGLAVSEGNPAWKYTIGGTALSEFGTLIPGDGSGAVAGSFVISAFHQGPLYQFIVPAGSRLRVLSDSWALGASTRPEYQFRFREGNAEMDAIFDRSGALLIARPGGQSGRDVIVGKGWTGFQDIIPRAWFRDSRGPAINEDSHGVLWQAVRQSDGVWEFSSDGAGFQGTWQKGLKISGTEASVQRVIVLSDDARGALLRVGSVWKWQTSRDDYTSGLDIPGASGSVPLSISQGDTGQLYAVSPSGVLAYSDDDGKTFKPQGS